MMVFESYIHCMPRSCEIFYSTLDMILDRDHTLDSEKSEVPSL